LDLALSIGLCVGVLDVDEGLRGNLRAVGKVAVFNSSPALGYIEALDESCGISVDFGRKPDRRGGQ